MKRARILTLGFLFGLLFPSVYSSLGDWTEGSYQGDWEYRNHDSWKSPYSHNYSCFVYETGRVDYWQKWSFVVRLTNFTIEGLWEIDECYQIFNGTLVGQGHTVNIIVEHKSMIHLLGYKSIFETAVTIKQDGAVKGSLSVFTYRDVEVYAWRSTESDLSIGVLFKKAYTDSEATAYIDCLNLSLGCGWFQWINTTQKVEKQFASLGVIGGSYWVHGMIQGDKKNEAFTYGSVDPLEKPYSFVQMTLAKEIALAIWEGLKVITDAIYEALPSNVQVFIDRASQMIYGFGSFVWNILSFLWNMIIYEGGWSIFIGAYGLYLLYLIMSCMEEGDWTPLFEHLFWVLGIAISAGHALLMVLQTIANLIKWW